jgi:hypothetical protein
VLCCLPWYDQLHVNCINLGLTICENICMYACNCQETKRCQEKHLGKKWLHMNDTVAFKKLVRCSKPTDLRQLGTFLYKVRCTWEHHAKKSVGEEEVL